MLVTVPDSPPLVDATLGRTIETAASWHVLWARSNCEQLVHDQLVSRGFHVFLPTLEVWSRRAGGRR